MEQFVKSQLEFNRLLLSVSNLLQGTLYGKLAHLQTEFVGQLINPSVGLLSLAMMVTLF
jgi:hypothetical protein